MVSYIEENTGISRYLATAVINVSKETWLRFRSWKMKLWIVIILLLFFLVSQILALVLAVMILFLFLIQYAFTIREFVNIYKIRSRFYPGGITIEFNNDWIQKSTVFGDQIDRFYWKDITTVYNNAYIRNITLYDQKSKRYILLFSSDSCIKEFRLLRDVAFENSKTIV